MQFVRKYKIILFGMLWLLVIGALAWSVRGSNSDTGEADSDTASLSATRPTWQQDFSTQPDGAPDPAYWTYNTDPLTPTYNDEEQAYTNRLANARIQGGRLIIEARKETYTYPGTTNARQYQYTSARLDLRPTSQKQGENNKAFSRGKLVARLKLPEGSGTWPAFWLLSDTQPHTAARNASAADWESPKFYKHDGEIDIIEGYGKPDGSTKTEATVHAYRGPATGTAFKAPTAAGDGQFHDYGVEITPDAIRFMFDGKPYATYRKTSDNTDRWPFTEDNKMYAILNLAMGGDGGYQIEGDGPWQLEVASVRFYSYRE